MKVPRVTKQTPPGLWRYRHPQTGRLFSGGYSLSRICAMVREYNQANSLPDIPNLDQEIIAYICNEEPDYCVSTEPPTLAEKAKTFTRAMVEWASYGFPVVDQAVLEERRATCAACPYWRGEEMFGYGACGKCGCSGLKLFLPTQKCPDGRWKV